MGSVGHCLLPIQYYSLPFIFQISLDIIKSYPKQTVTCIFAANTLIMGYSAHFFITTSIPFIKTGVLRPFSSFIITTLY